MNHSKLWVKPNCINSGRKYHRGHAEVVGNAEVSGQ